LQLFTQAGRFLALGETIVRTHLNLLPSIQQPLEQIAISAVNMAICASGAHRSSHHIPWN
jgi:hypothetical protein